MGWMKILQSSCDIHRKTASVAAVVIRIGWSIGKRKSENIFISVKRKDLPSMSLVNRSGSSNHSKGGSALKKGKIYQ